MISGKILLLPIVLPLLAGGLNLLIPHKIRGIKEALSLLFTLFTLILAITLFKSHLSFSFPWCGFGFDFALKLYHFSAFILLAIASLSFLVTLYAGVFMQGRASLNQFFAYLLITVAFANGVVLADNFLLLLFFWEGLLLTLFGMIIIGGKEAYKSAIKAFVIVGITDLCFMLGIALTGHLAGTFVLSQICLPLNFLGSMAFLLLMIGSLAKGGAMPFHSWIPDAALDAPLPFMALLPAALDKLVGIYMVARIALNFFQFTPLSWLSGVLMIVGALTILLAVLMALIQKDFKRLLAYHAVSQMGYMVLGIGTAIPAGIIGGLFHMLNNAMYKSCLFMAGGAVEKQAGTTDLSQIGGLGRKMPLTFICFLIAAASISGVPPFNGFFSKELIYDGALGRGLIFYLAAVIGSFFTAASFLKLGHAAFLGRTNNLTEKVKEASFVLWFPMVVIVAGCVFFGVNHSWPLMHLIQPILSEHLLEGHNYAGMPANLWLVLITLLVLAAALLNHWYGVSKTGKGLKAVDHIHYAPGIAFLYDRAEKRYFDPYEIGMHIAHGVVQVGWWIDRSVDWFYDVFTVRLTWAFTGTIRWLHSGNYAFYLVWILMGTVAAMVYLLM